MTDERGFEVTHRLTPDEVSSVLKEYHSSLLALHERYIPEIDVSTDISRRPEYLDAIRTSWLLDHPNHRPPYATVVRALGPALGLLLQDVMGMHWCVIKDSVGENISMTGTDRAGSPVAVLLFSYIEKRETVQNGDIFANLVNLLSETLVPKPI